MFSKFSSMIAAFQLRINQVKVRWKEDNGNKFIITVVLAAFLSAGLILIRQVTILFTKAMGETVSLAFTPAAATLPSATTYRIILDSKTNQIGFARVVFQFNPQKVKLTGSLIPGSVLGRVISLTDLASANSTGKVVIVLGANPGSSMPTGSFEIANFAFTPVSVTTNDTTALTFISSDLEITEKSQVDLPINVTSAQISLNPVNVTNTPTLTPATPTPVVTPTVIPVNKPLIITNVSAAGVNPTTETISWNLSDYGSGQVEYGRTTAYGLLSIPETSLNWNYHSQSLNRLSPGTLYHYRVKSTNKAGLTSVSSDRTFITLGLIKPTPNFVPPTPTPSLVVTRLVITNVQVSNITQNSASISWNLSDYGTGQVKFGTTTAYGQFSIPETSFDWNHHSQNITNLIPGTFYHFRVMSTNKAGLTTISPDYTFYTLQ